MGNPKFRPVKRCILCHNRADSKEHAWSEWAIKRLAHPGGTYGECDGIKYYDPKQKHLTVKCVCEDCNEGWMKRLEETVIPTIGAMMHDHPMALDIPQQWAISRWALKCSMVFEFINRTESIFYTDAEREALRLCGDIPSRTFVAIARGLGVDYFFSWGNELTADVAQFDGQAMKLNGLVTTIAYRRFVVEVVSVRANPPNGTRLILQGNLERWKNVVVSVWPTYGIARWANTHSISSLEAMDRFHNRIGSASIEALETLATPIQSWDSDIETPVRAFVSFVLFVAFVVRFPSTFSPG